MYFALKSLFTKEMNEIMTCQEVLCIITFSYPSFKVGDTVCDLEVGNLRFRKIR